jgi:hypothetical protein
MNINMSWYFRVRQELEKKESRQMENKDRKEKLETRTGICSTYVCTYEKRESKMCVMVTVLCG